MSVSGDQELKHHRRAKKVLFSTQCIQNFGYEDKISDMSQVFHRLRFISYCKNYEMILENQLEAFFTAKLKYQKL